MKFKIGFFIVSFVLIGLIIFMSSNKEKVGWIELGKVYNDFEMKKELESNLTKTQKARQALMDSLEIELKMLSRQIQDEKGKDKNKVNLFEVKKEDYFTKKRKFEEDNDAQTKQYNEQILRQLNQYVKDYGKKYGYTFIYGAEGSGALMYADEGKEITSEMKKYINEKYKGNTE